jgi:endoglycosylceramidase
VHKRATGLRVIVGFVTLLAACGDGGDHRRAATHTPTGAVATATRATTTPTVALPSPTTTATAIVATPTTTATAVRPTLTAPALTPTATQPSATATAPPPTVTQPAATATLEPSASATPSATATPTTTAGEDGAVAPLRGAGRWFVDALGRVVLMHGVNMVSKQAPYYPAAFGFGGDDAAFLAAEGFNALRLGVDFRGLMPTPGIVETDYIDHLAETVAALTQHGIFVLMDFHQDGFAPMFNGNGFPDWLAIGDGLPNPPDAVFPAYYIQNPAMQRAFENFWANRAGPNGVGLQEYFVQGVEAIVARFAAEPMVLGTELMNEPFPGSNWLPCLMAGTGCPDLEHQLLEPFYHRATEAARRIAPDRFVFVEPFVLFNFGQGPTSLPGTEAGRVLSFHSYAVNAAGEEAVIAYAVDAATRDAAPLLLTEFGARVDPVFLNRITAEMEHGLVPWMFWSYDGEVIGDLRQPAGPDNLRDAAAFDALVRPYPIATTGTPTEIAFDPTEKVFRFTYDTTPPTDVAYASNALTVVSVPGRQYPDGYDVHVEGAVVTSLPHAPLLTMRNMPDATHVSMQVSPAEPSAGTAHAWRVSTIGAAH